MNPSKRDLDVQEDVPFQKRVWCVERIGWIIMALLTLAGVIGLLGPGPLSKKMLWDRTSRMKAEYNRFDRYQGPATLKLNINAELIAGSETPLVLNREFIEHIEVKRIDPEPERVESRGDDFTFFFGTSSNRPASIVFHYEPNRFGKMPIRVEVTNGISLHLEQFYFP